MTRISRRTARRRALYLVPAFFAALVVLAPLYGVLVTNLKGVRDQTVAMNDWPLRQLGDEYLLGLARIRQAVLPDPGPGLPLVRLYVSERIQQLLLANLPESARHWRRARVLRPGGSLDKVRVRLRGLGNPRNYAFDKKDWRIKTRRSRLYHGRRVHNYIAPKSADMINEVLAADLARRAGVLMPTTRPVEMYVNDVSQGIYYEIEKLGETFLRTNGLMPVNLYKGEPRLFRVSGLSVQLFESPAVWTKLAENNRLPKTDWSDLEQFLDLRRAAGSSNTDFERLIQMAPVGTWARFSAFQVLTQSVHNDAGHNMRLVVDDQSGTVTPVAWDVVPMWGEEGHADYFLFNVPSHPLMKVLKRDARFALAELNQLYRLAVEERVLSAAVRRLDELRPAYAASLERYVEHLRRVSFARALALLVRPSATLDAQARTRASMLALEQWIGRQIGGPVEASWSQAGKGALRLVVEGVRPLDELEIDLLPGTPRPAQFALDRDHDGRFGPSDLVLPAEGRGDAVRLRAVWLANREGEAISGTRTGQRVMEGANVRIVPTVFNIVADGPFEVQAVRGRNALDGSAPSALTRGTRPAVRFVPSNLPVLKATPKPEVWSGIVRVEETKVLTRPVRIAAGTRIEIASGAGLVFRGRLEIAGTAGAPVIVRARDGDPFGALAVHGPGATGSRLRYLDIAGGSGMKAYGTAYTAMLSVNDTSDVVIENLRMRDNRHYDDMLHVVYGRDIVLRSADLGDALADAVDIDISTVLLEDVRIARAGNDCIDLMTSTVTVRRADLSACGDKGLSIGEGSRATIEDTAVRRSAIGIEVKDGTRARASGIDFEANSTQINAYNKIWRYGDGGRIEVTDSRFAAADGGTNTFTADAVSAIVIANSAFEGGVMNSGRVRIDGTGAASR